MADETTAAIVAEHETERREDENETAERIAELHAETEQHAHDAAVEIATAHAEAAVGVAEAEARGREEWRDETAALRQMIADQSLSLATMAEAIATLTAAQSTQISPSPEPEIEPEPVIVAEVISPDAAEEGRPEAESAAPRPAGRIRRAM